MFRTQRLDLVICLTLALATVVTYWDLFNHQFVNIDDTVYVTQNSFVQSGLSRQSVKWAFTTTRAEFWHPLTWLSYMLDTWLFGVRPAGYLFTNLLLHIVNTILLYLIFIKMTAGRWPSAFVAALFALHPLHVESVAWIAERKDVLSALFWMLTTYAYLFYAKHSGRGAYVLVFLLLILGLMAKPTLVTLPFVLLLLDYWPLGRFEPEGPPAASMRTALVLIREKIPLLLMVFIFSLTAYLVQKSGVSISSAEHYTLTDRVFNAILAYAGYIGKMIWPLKLAVFYPFPDNFPIWKVGGAAVMLLALSIFALKWARRRPFVIVGWLWYLGTLVPVIGLVKIGDFAMADRYMYIPLIGLAIIIAWGLPVVLAEIPARKAVLATAAVIYLAGLSVATQWQVKSWTNSFTLFSQALQATEDNFFAHFGLGHAFASQGKFDAASSHFAKAVQLNPTKATLYNDWGRSLVAQAKYEEASRQFSAALELAPHLAATHYYLGNLRVILAQFDQAVYHLSEALRLHPDFPGTGDYGDTASVAGYHELVSLFDSQEKLAQVIEQNQAIVAADSQNLAAVRQLMIAYAIKADHDRALAILRVDTSISSRKKDITRGYTNWQPGAR